NRAGIETKLVKQITLVQRKLKAPAPDNTPKFRDLTVSITSFSAFDVTLKGPTGETVGEKTNQTKSVTFPKLEAGNYQLEWTNKYNGKSGGPKNVVLQVPANGLPPQSISIP